MMRSMPSTTARRMSCVTPTDTAWTWRRNPAMTGSASPAGGSRRCSATLNDDACSDGIISLVKMPRITSRMASEETIRTMPSRVAMVVAMVDLPTPVVPPSSTMSGTVRS
jgi:hypothetical protein